MRMPLDVSAAQLLLVMAGEVERLTYLADMAASEFQSEPMRGKDGRWAKRYGRNIGREIDKLMVLVSQFRMAADFGEMDPVVVQNVLDGADRALAGLRNASALAAEWERRVPMDVFEDLPLKFEELPELIEDLREMCTDNLALMRRLENVRLGTDEMSVMLLDEIEEGQEDGIDIAASMLRQATAWRKRPDADEAMLVRFEKGVAVFEAGCRLLMRDVEETRPFSVEAILEVFVKEHLPQAIQGSHVAH